MRIFQVAVLAALMGLPVVYVFTHDSIFLGEDGPTHQPISQLASLRSIPGLVTLRPADAHETAAAWRLAIARQDGPTALALSRQKLPVLEAPDRPVEEGVGRGAYVAWEAEPGRAPELLLVATGSELALALGAARRLADAQCAVRVVSMPSWELFAAQSAAYRDATFPSARTPTVVLEALSGFGWHRWTGPWTEFVTRDGFGASAPADDLAAEFGFTEEAVLERCEAALRAFRA